MATKHGVLYVRLNPKTEARLNKLCARRAGQRGRLVTKADVVRELLTTALDRELPAKGAAR